jgi:hypothetical protein
VTGKANSPDGFRVYTPDDAKVDGGTFTAEEWQALVDGQRAPLLDAESDRDAGNGVAGRASNSTTESVVGSASLGAGSTMERLHSEIGCSTTTAHSGGINNAAGTDYGDAVTAFRFVTVGGGENNTASSSRRRSAEAPTTSPMPPLQLSVEAS